MPIKRVPDAADVRESYGVDGVRRGVPSHRAATHSGASRVKHTSAGTTPYEHPCATASHLQPMGRLLQ
ncbi:MAG: hypothetical protein ABIY55_01540 [Kofleriaceae bacterium]